MDTVSISALETDSKEEMAPKLPLRGYFFSVSNIVFWSLFFLGFLGVSLYEVHRFFVFATTERVYDEVFEIEKDTHGWNNLLIFFEKGFSEFSWLPLLLVFLFLLVAFNVFSVLFFILNRKRIEVRRSVVFLLINTLSFFILSGAISYATIILSVSRVVNYEKSNEDNFLLLRGTAIIEKESIKKALEESQAPIHASKDIFDIEGREDELTFAESFAIPFLNKEKSSQNYFPNNEPYVYFPGKGILVHDTETFLEDLGYETAEKYLTQAFPEYKAPRVPSFEVVSDEVYEKRFKEEEIKRIKKVIFDLQKAYRENLEAISDAKEIIANTPARIAEEDAQYAEYVTKAEKVYRVWCGNGEVRDYCTKWSKSISENKAIVAENRRIIAEDKAASEELIRLGSSYNSQIKENEAVFKKELSSLEAGGSGDGVVASQIKNAVGNFFPPGTLLVRILPEDEAIFSDYLEVVNHEILHYYASRSRQEETMPTFLDEGLTEAFSDESLGYPIGNFSHSAYEAEVRIVALLAQKMDLETLKNLYFSGNMTTFEKEFKKAFPGVSWDAFLLLGEKINSDTWLEENNDIESYSELERMEELLLKEDR